MFRSSKTTAEDLCKCSVLLKCKEGEESSFGMGNNSHRQSTKGPSVCGTKVVADVCKLIEGYEHLEVMCWQRTGIQTV